MTDNVPIVAHGPRVAVVITEEWVSNDGQVVCRVVSLRPQAELFRFTNKATARKQGMRSTQPSGSHGHCLRGCPTNQGSTEASTCTSVLGGKG